VVFHSQRNNLRSRRSRRNFLIGGATAFLSVFGWRLLPDEPSKIFIGAHLNLMKKSVKSFIASSVSRRNFRQNSPERGLTARKV